MSIYLSYKKTVIFLVRKGYEKIFVCLIRSRAASFPAFCESRKAQSRPVGHILHKSKKCNTDFYGSRADGSAGNATGVALAALVSLYRGLNKKAQVVIPELYYHLFLLKNFFAAKSLIIL